jgi:protein phosphatase
VTGPPPAPVGDEGAPPPAGLEPPAPAPAGVAPPDQATDAAPALVLRVSARSHRGSVRPRNEDAAVVGDGWIRDDARDAVFALASLPAVLVLGVADGMGGHAGGAEASRRVAERVIVAAQNWPADADAEALAAAWRAVLAEAHRELLALAAADASLAGMGTTWTGLACTPRAAVLAHVGDSRCYRLRDGVLSLQTRDHTLDGSLLAGATRSSVLTNAIGGGAEMAVELHDLSRRILPGDVYLLCSDGAADATTPDELVARALASGETADAVIRAALERGGADNITAIRVAVVA